MNNDWTKLIGPPGRSPRMVVEAAVALRATRCPGSGARLNDRGTELVMILRPFRMNACLGRWQRQALANQQGRMDAQSDNLLVRLSPTQANQQLRPAPALICVDGGRGT